MRKWLKSRMQSLPEAGGGALEPLAHELPPLPSERSTGVVFAVVAAIVAAVFRNEPVVLAAALAAALGFAGLAAAAPHWLAPLNRAWFALALLLNRIVSPIIMGVLFAGLIVPAGLVMQMRRDPLRSKRAPHASSYWIDRTAPATPPDMRDQF